MSSSLSVVSIASLPLNKLHHAIVSTQDSIAAASNDLSVYQAEVDRRLTGNVTAAYRAAGQPGNIQAHAGNGSDAGRAAIDWLLEN